MSENVQTLNRKIVNTGMQNKYLTHIQCTFQKEIQTLYLKLISRLMQAQNVKQYTS